MLNWLARPNLAAEAMLVVFCLLCAVLLIEVVAVASGASRNWLLLAEALPMPFFLAAIWSIRRAVLMVGAGAALRSLVSAMLARVGLALLLGGLAMVVAVPTIVWLTTGKGAVLRYDVAAITVGVVGLGLMILARVVAEAEELQAELDEIL